MVHSEYHADSTGYLQHVEQPPQLQVLHNFVISALQWAK